MKDDTPDYSSYTLDDLHDVARRVNKRLYPERYALVLQEIEKRKSVPVTVAPEPSPDGCSLQLVRFCGGLVLGSATPYLILRIISFFYGGTELFYPAVHFIAPMLALGCAYYFSFTLQESGAARNEYSSTFTQRDGDTVRDGYYSAEEAPRIFNPSASQNCLSGVLRFCGGGLLTAMVTAFFLPSLFPPHGPNYGDGIGYGMAMMFWALVAGCVGGVVFVLLPFGRKK